MQLKYKINQVILMAALLFFVTSCMKEKGTYDHQVINEINIDTIASKTVQLGGLLSIEPEISQTIENSQENLEYVWYWYKFGFTKVDTLGTDKNLNFTVPMRTDLGAYTTVLKIFDKKSGVFFKKVFQVTVTAAAAEGVLVLSNLDGNAEVGILNTARNFVGNLYHNANGSHPGKNPVHIGFIKVNAVPYLNGIIIMCDDQEGGVIAHHMDFVKQYDYKKFFFVPPGTVKPQRYYNGITGLDARYDFIINNNQLHVREYRNAQRSEEKTFFKPQVAPTDAVIGKDAIVNGTTLLFYDNTNYKFVMVGITSLQFLSKSFIPVFLGTQNPNDMVFDPNNAGLEMISMAPGWKNYGYGIFKDPVGGQLYRLSFSIASLGFSTPFSAYYKKPIANAPHIGTATDYAYSISDPYLYYAKDNLLYRYDLEFDQVAPIYNLDTVMAGSKIDKLYMRYYAGQTTYSSRLYVASSETGKTGKNGSIHALQINRNGTVARIDSVYKNVSGKVVSMDYKF